MKLNIALNIEHAHYDECTYEALVSHGSTLEELLKNAKVIIAGRKGRQDILPAREAWLVSLIEGYYNINSGFAA